MRNKSVKKTRTPAAKRNSARKPRTPGQPKASRQFSNNAFRSINAGIAANPREAAPKVLEALANTRAVTTKHDGSIHIAPGQYHHYFETVIFAIEQFEAVLLKISINTLPQEALNPLNDQLKKLNLALHKIKPMIDKIHPEEKALEANLTLCAKLQAHEAILQQRIELIELNLHTVAISPARSDVVEEPAVEEPVVTVPEITFNPPNIDEMLSEFKANIANIKHTLQAAKQEKMIFELLGKINLFMNSQFIQVTPKNKAVFYAILGEMHASLLHVVNRLSSHPVSKLKRAFARTEHALSLFCADLPETDIQPSSQNDIMSTQAGQPQVTDEIVDGVSCEAAIEDVITLALDQPFDPSKTQSGDVVRHLVLQSRESVRYEELMAIIPLFKKNNIIIAGQDINALEANLNNYIFSLKMKSKNIDNALSGLYAYNEYLKKHHDDDNVNQLYVETLYQGYCNYTRQNASRDQHTFFSSRGTSQQHSRNASENRDKSPSRKNR